MSDTEQTKICTRCGKEKPADAEHFPTYKTTSGEIRLRVPCRECARELKNAAKAARIAAGEPYKERSRQDPGVAAQKAASDRRYRQTDKGQARDAAYRQSEKGKEANRRSSRAYIQRKKAGQTPETAD